MKPLLLVGLAVLTLIALPARAEHRATQLGHPDTRFAPPLTKPEQLRALFADEKLADDVVAILRQAGWKGDVADLRQAVATVPIEDIKLPKGTRMPFMSARKNGKPVTLVDVVWAGKEPVEAYAFEFASKGRRYRCITPKPCSNFFVVDLGPLPRPSLVLSKKAPAETGVCDPFEVKLIVRNPGSAPATGVRVTDFLPPGLRSAEQATNVVFEVGELKPGASRELVFKATAARPGVFKNLARASCAESLWAEASSTTTVRAASLALDCAAPAEVTMTQPAEVCLTVRNIGDAPERRASVLLPIPPGASVTNITGGGKVSEGAVTWELSDLAVAGSQRVCASFMLPRPGTLAFSPTAHGACGTPVASQCQTTVGGVRAILVELVDLEDPIEVGNVIRYELRVTNQGSEALQDLQVIGVIPEEQEFVSGGGATTLTADGRKLSSAALGSLDPKAVATWHIETKALKAGDSRFEIQITTQRFQLPIPEVESTTLF